jgi:hypothetical protein
VWRAADGGNSHVFQFHRDFDTPGDDKLYLDGPGTWGFEVARLVDHVCAFVRGRLDKEPGARVSLVGHSRGGLVAILAARRLGIPIHFLGLYDAVDRHVGPPGGGGIPGNVRHVCHAVRHPSVRSRPYFGHTGRHCDAGVLYYHECLFRATHGGVGGAPHGGANERRAAIVLTVAAATAGLIAGPPGAVLAGAWAWRAIRVAVSLDVDRAESQRADRWMRSEARAFGLPIA